MIGNWINDIFGNPVKVRCIKEGGLSIKGDGYSASCEMFNPIVLDDDVILKCGLEYFALGIFVYNNEIEFSLKKENNDIGYTIRIHDLGWVKVACIKVKYLHQLQNIFKVLTNKELDIHL